MKNLDIKINEPCHENWNAMTPKQQGRFCGSCQKDVVDFTNMTADEVKSYFVNYSGPICGRFKTTQLTTEKKVNYVSLSDYTKKFIRAFAMVFIMFTALHTPIQAQEYVKGDVVCKKTSSVRVKGMVYGADGDGISNVHVQLWKNGRRAYDVLTDDYGIYNFKAELGPYQVRVFKAGFVSHTNVIELKMSGLIGDFLLKKRTKIEEPQIMGMIKMGKPIIKHKEE